MNYPSDGLGLKDKVCGSVVPGLGQGVTRASPVSLWISKFCGS